ncbi:hypothetical protein BDR26DRAFT_858507 [Obelidium mucronatum]|nr:hypothetical protein BDR26DRAFT_858507 [Obelidium mucronatum]
MGFRYENWKQDPTEKNLINTNRSSFQGQTMANSFLILALIAVVVSAAPPTFEYHNSPLISGMRVHPVYVGSFEFKTQIEDFLDGYLKSSAFYSLNQYSVPPDNVIGWGARDTSYDATYCPENSKNPCGIINANSYRSDTWKLLANFMTKSITSNPYTGRRQFFPIFFGKEYDASFKNCAELTAMHGQMKVWNDLVYYAFFPYCSYKTCVGCTRIGNQNGFTAQVDGYTVALAHEIIDAVTNPSTQSGWVAYDWPGNAVAEIADPCDHQAAVFRATVKGKSMDLYTQKYWSVLDNACVSASTKVATPAYVSPPPIPNPNNRPKPSKLMPYLGDGKTGCKFNEKEFSRVPYKFVKDDGYGLAQYCFNNSTGIDGKPGFTTYYGCNSDNCDASMPICEDVNPNAPYTWEPCCVVNISFGEFSCPLWPWP